MCQLKFAIIISLHERAACINTTESTEPKQAGMQSGQQKKNMRKKKKSQFYYK